MTDAVLTETDPPRVYLIAPPDLDPAALAARLQLRLDQAAQDGDEVACLLLRRPVGAAEAEWRAALAAILPITRKIDLAVMLEDRADLVRRLDADGVHLSAPDLTAQAAARTLIGDLNLGVFCGVSRHEAIDAAEAGADYVAFAQDCAEITWWTQMMAPPCAAWPADADAPIAADLGAEFIGRYL